MEQKHKIHLSKEASQGIDLIIENRKLSQRLEDRTAYSNNLKTVLQQIYSARSFNVIKTFWVIRNLIKFSIICPLHLFTNRKFVNNLLKEDDQYDRMEYLNKILNSKSYNFLVHARNPINYFTGLGEQSSQLNSQLNIRIYKNREQYLDEITNSKSFQLIKLYWQTKSLCKLAYLLREEPPNKYDRRINQLFGVEGESLSKKQKTKTLLSTELSQIEDIQQTENWQGVTKTWEEMLTKYPNDEMIINRAKLSISFANRLQNTDEYNRQISKYLNKIQSKKQNKIVIYSAISRNYDSIKLPEKIDSRLDYVLFTDTEIPVSHIFKVRPITYFNSDPTRTARYVKTHPHLLLNSYDYAIWIDSSIAILDDIYPMIDKFINSRKSIAAIPHPSRTSLYEEAESCILREKDDPQIIEKQIHYYQSLDFESHDLIESGFMMFDLRNYQTINFLNTWWQQIDNYSKRDQLSINFALEKNHIKWHRLTRRPKSVRNHHSFALGGHDDGNGLANKLLHKISDSSVDPYNNQPYSTIRDKRIKARNKHKIDIVICVHNAYEDVKKCIQSVTKTRKKNVHQNLIIVDDASDAITANYLKKYTKNKSWIKLLRNEKAVGYTKAANQGLKASKGDLVILLNSDTIVTDGWAQKLADAIHSTQGAGIVGPLSNAAGSQSLPDIRSSQGQTAINALPPNTSIEAMNKYCESWTPIDILPRTPLIHGFCIGITRQVIDTIGYFDINNFPNGYGEENDYCLRATDAGFSLVVATHTYVFHAKTKSYSNAKRLQLAKAGAKALQKLYGRNRIENAILSMDSNLLLDQIRIKSQKIY